MWNRGNGSEPLVPPQTDEGTDPEAPSSTPNRRKSSFLTDPQLQKKYVELVSVAEGTVLQMTNPKLRIFRHSALLAVAILVLNFGITAGVIYYYMVHSCETLISVMLNWTSVYALTVLKSNPGVSVTAAYAIGASSTLTGSLTTSQLYTVWADQAEECPSDDDTCGGAVMIGVLYEDCYSFSEALAAAVSYTTYVDICVTLLVVLIYGACTGQLKGKLGRDRVADILKDEAAQITVGSDVMELQEQNKEMQQQNKEMREEMDALLAALGNSDIRLSKKNLLR